VRHVGQRRFNFGKPGGLQQLIRNARIFQHRRISRVALSYC
jgi:hypothetical protein